LLTVLFLLPCSRAVCQDGSVNTYIIGKVIAKEAGDPLDNVSINLYAGNKIIYSLVTDSAGEFKIWIDYYKQADYIILHKLNFDDVRLDNLKSLGNSGKIINLGNIRLNIRNIQLDAVEIKSKKRYRDTTIIDLSKQVFERSVTIDDLLSSNYGFYKDSKGKLYYKGKLVTDLVVNGRDFFGKNNTDIYTLLPALILKNMQVIETNIDSITNITTLRPAIKLNLNFKEKYSSGKFGNASLGAGTAKRYLAATDLYTYKKNEQISVALNSNNINIGDSPPQEPAISFSSNGNNTTVSSTKFSYSNTIGKKIDVNFLAKGKIEDRKFISQSERQDEAIKQFSTIANNSASKSLAVTDARLNVRYSIDSLNTVNIVESFNYNRTNTRDSLKYQFKSDFLNTISNLYKKQLVVNSTNSTELAYSHRFRSKKGRLLDVLASRVVKDFKNNEFDDVYSSNNNIGQSYFVNGDKDLKDNLYNLRASFTEPFSESAYINVFLAYKNSYNKYGSALLSDSAFNFVDKPVKIYNNYFSPGLKIKQQFKKVSFDGEVSGILDKRRNIYDDQSGHLTFFNIDADLKADIKFSGKKGMIVDIKTTANYPEVSQLININNSFNLISQASGNIKLRPEVDNGLKVAYIITQTNSENMSINAGMDLYTSKYGMNINAMPNSIQSVFVDNLGNAVSSSAGFLLTKNSVDKFNYNYMVSVNYQELPTVINGKISKNSSLSLNQVVSTTKVFFKGIFSVSPVISATYSRYKYDVATSSMVNFIYSDKLSFMLSGFRLDLYPIVNYSHNINSQTSFSMNGALRKELFKKAATLWLQGYDLFNSFRFNNNLLGPSYVETVKYSNVNRYIILGISFKFNNMK